LYGIVVHQLQLTRIAPARQHFQLYVLYVIRDWTVNVCVVTVGVRTQRVMCIGGDTSFFFLLEHYQFDQMILLDE
jgi:hypothetical protein